MTPRECPSVEPQIVHYQDAAGTWFAAELIRSRLWSGGITSFPDPELADVRIVLLDTLPEPLPDVAPWLVVLPLESAQEPRLIEEAATRAWPRSPWFRDAGPTAEAYVEAGFQALCPPHPACRPGPGTRDMLMEFLDGRPGVPGRLAREGRDAANRLLRVLWRHPSAFADDVLRERIRDEGGRHLIELTDFLEAAAIAPEAEEFVDFALERQALLDRLTPIRYFTHPVDHDRAAALAVDWRERYTRLYASHYRAVYELAQSALVETATAQRVLAELNWLNGAGRPVGGDSVRRLRAALEELRDLPPSPDHRMAMTGGVMLGRASFALAEVRLAAAAVLAAMDVHHRRSARVSDTASHG